MRKYEWWRNILNNAKVYSEKSFVRAFGYWVVGGLNKGVRFSITSKKRRH